MVENSGTERIKYMAANFKIAAIVLAAGQSTRAGPVNKLTHSIDGTAMVRTVVDTLVSTAVSTVIVVTGFEALKIEHALTGQPVSFTHNPDYASGMGGSIGSGVKALADDVDGILICLGDMPHVKASTIKTVMKAMAEGHICVPVSSGRQGHPVLFSRFFFNALKSIRGDKGGKAVMKSNAQRVHKIPVDDEGILIDHDTVI